MEIYAQYEKISRISSEFDVLERRLDEIQDRYTRIYRSVEISEMKVAAKTDIDKRMTKIISQIESDKFAVRGHSRFLKRASELYTTCENSNRNVLQQLKKDLYDNLTSVDISIKNSEQQKNIFDMGKWLDFKKDSDWLSYISKFLGIKHPLWGKTLSVFASGLKMFENFVSGKYTSKSTIENLLNYSKDASKLWNNAYSTMENYYKQIDKLFDIKKGEKGLESQFKNTTAGKASIVLSFLSPFLDFGKQAVNSYEAYSADGSMSITDWGALMVDSSLSGLSNLINTVITKIPIIGIPLSIAYSEYVEQGNVVENVSNCMKNWAINTGNSLGNYIRKWSSADLKNDSMISNLWSAGTNHIRSTIHDWLHPNDRGDWAKNNGLNRYCYN